MKKFAFPLARVLEWRRTRVAVEEAALGKLNAELHSIELRAAQARAERARTETAILSAASTTGAELAAFEAYRKSLAAESARLAGQASECRQRITAQMQAVTRAHRDVRLLENLHGRRHAAWTSELGKEIDREAEDLYLGNLGRQ